MHMFVCMCLRECPLCLNVCVVLFLSIENCFVCFDTWVLGDSPFPLLTKTFPLLKKGFCAANLCFSLTMKVSFAFEDFFFR